MNIRLTMGTVFLALAVAATGCGIPAARTGYPVQHNLPPAEMLMHPGPGVDGPGPGVIYPMMPPGMDQPPEPSTVQVLFSKPDACQVKWDVGGVGMYDSEPLVFPGRQNFPQGGVYRLKLTNIEGREGVELYPTLEVGPMTPRTAAYLAHAAVPVQFNDDDFDQVLAGNFVTKVIYIPDPEFQELALADVDTLVSTRLDPGVDPVVEADRRGSILAIIRMGNKDMEMPGSNDAFAAQAAFSAEMNGGPVAGPMGGFGMTPNYVAGVTAPPYGMPMTGTSIGLPGPPHLPLGGPAGMQSYTIHNHTPMQIPGPTPNINVHVKQSPGLSYPRPADTVLIHEQTVRPPHFNNQPPADMVYGAPPVSSQGGNCRLHGIGGCRQCMGGH